MSKARRTGVAATVAAVPFVPSPTASARSTGCAPGFLIDGRRNSTRPTSGWRSSRSRCVRPGATCRPGSSRPTSGVPGPGVVLVHGWDSARDRMLGNIQFLQRGRLPLPGLRRPRSRGQPGRDAAGELRGEFGADASAAFATLVGRPEVTIGAILGHSMGAVGAILAAAADPRVAALVSSSAPSDPRRLVSETFRLAHLPFPAPVAGPLELADDPRVPSPAGPPGRRHQRRCGHRPLSRAGPARPRRARPGHPGRARRAASRGRGAPGDDRRQDREAASSWPDGGHTWLYEDEGYRREIASFLARELAGPLSPEAAADAAAAIAVVACRSPKRSLVGDRADRMVGAMLAGPRSGAALPAIGSPVDQ